MITGCPVCRRSVLASDQTGRVPKHRDTALNQCPMSGRRIPLECIENERRIA